MIRSYLHRVADRLIAYEQSPRRLALTCCLGIFIGFSPFIGFHTVMTIVIGWFFAFNIAGLWIISHIINNPWTMTFVYTVDHIVGIWIFDFFNIDSMQWNPSWFEIVCEYIKTHTGMMGFSLSAFLVGGNLIGIVLSVMLYPFFKYFFTKHLSHKNNDTI